MTGQNTSNPNNAAAVTARQAGRASPQETRGAAEEVAETLFQKGTNVQPPGPGGIRASGAPSERAFSTGGIGVTRHRSAQTHGRLVFLANNLQQLL